MKRNHFRIILLSLVLALLITPSMVFAIAAETEPNDTYLTANSFTLGSGLGGTISPSGDKDYFSFSASAGNTYVIQATRGTISDLSLRLYGTNGTSLLSFDLSTLDNTNTSIAVISWTCTSSGTYYAEVDGTSNMYTGDYRLRIANDDHGNDKAGSTAVIIGEPENGALDYASDDDFFSFPASMNVQYTITTTVGTAVDALVYIYGTDGITLLDSDTVGGGSSVTWICTATGTYYVKVNGSNTGTYTLSITGDVYGDTYGASTIVSVGATTSGYIGTVSDIDYFTFSATAGHVYTIDTTLRTLTGLTLTIYDANGTTVIDTVDTNLTNGDYQLTIPTTDLYFFSIEGLSGGTGTYTVRVVDNSASSSSDDEVSCFIATASYEENKEQGMFERIVVKLKGLFE